MSVSVVIPTTGRPSLAAAIASVLTQGAAVHEVIVVADTADEISVPSDPRVILLRSGPRAGGNADRMKGIIEATGTIIGLLDDDDVWHPDKLEKQLAAVGDAVDDTHWLSSSYVTRSSGVIWPERPIGDDEDLADYLFRKTALRGGQGALHTSTLLFPRALAIEAPFDTTLRFHQDTAWLLRLRRQVPALRVFQVASSLVSLFDDGPASVSKSITAEGSLKWMHGHLTGVTPRTRGDFIMTVPYFYALRKNDYRAALRCLVEAFVYGPPSLYGTLSAVTIPIKLRQANNL